MTKEAFTYALNHTPLPKGKTLWLYGDAYTDGDIYTPFYHQARKQQERGRTVFSAVADIPGEYDAVLIHAPKQQEETEGLLALALSRSKGFVMAVAPNDAGGNRLARLFQEYGLAEQQLSKDRCKIVYTTQGTKANQAILARNLALLTPHQLTMSQRGYWTVPGLFGWNKIDIGSELLLTHLPAELHGKVADFGCGFGYLSAALEAMPGIISVDAFDLDARAVDATQRNCGAKVKAIWQDIRTLEAKPIYDAIVMNPPFHNGKQEDVGLGEEFIRKAWASLRSGGRLFLVANRNLPYEHALPELTSLETAQDYKIMTGRKP